MNNHESFFRTRKSVPNLSAANRNRLMALLNAPSTVFASPQPACRIPPPRRHLLIGAVGPQKPDTLQGKAVRPPHPLWLFPAWGDLERQTSCPSSRPSLRVRPFRLSPRGPSSPPCPPAAHGRRHSRDVLPQAGWGGLEMTEGKAAPPSPLRRPAEGGQGLEQAMARHAEDCDRAGGCRRIHAKRRALSHLACFLAVMPSCPILR